MVTVTRASIIVFTFWITLFASLSFANELTELITSNSESQETPDTDKIIEVNSSTQDDKKIQTHLQKIFSEMDNVKNIKIHDIGIAANQDLQIAQLLALQTLDSMEGVLTEPKPIAVIEKLGNFNIILRIYAWTDQDKFDFLKVRSETIRQTKLAFDQAGSIMPEPTYQIKIGNDSGIDLTQNNRTGQEETLPIDTQPQMLAHTTIDISTDNTIENKVVKEQEHSDTLNLLNKNASQE